MINHALAEPTYTSNSLKVPDDVMEIFLQPGDFYFGEERTRITTLLGSCVAITVWHPMLHIGGMCHFLLPTCAAPTTGNELDGRYADQAMQMFQREIRQSRTQSQEYQLKIFGGGTMLKRDKVVETLSVPVRNIQAARTLAESNNFYVSCEDLGGSQHRYVMLDLWSGDVWVRRGPKHRVPEAQ